MVIQVREDNGAPLAKVEEFDRDIVRVDASAMAVINRSEVETQIDAAHRYPRQIKQFLNDAISMATLNEEIAASCIYSLPRDGKMITGPSARLAEIAASAYGNLHAGSRVLDSDGTTVSAQGVAWDIQKNYRVSIEARRSIIGRNRKRFSEDMIVMTGNAAASIAYRNAVFKVVPRAYIDQIMAAARLVAVGDAKTLDTRRTNAISFFSKAGITKDQVLALVDKPAVEDIGLTELEILLGAVTAIREDASRLEEFFPSKTATATSAAAVQKSAAKPASELEGKLKTSTEPKDAKSAGPMDVGADPAGLGPTPPCIVCGKSVTGERISSTTSDGVVGVRHPECSPLGIK